MTALAALERDRDMRGGTERLVPFDPELHARCFAEQVAACAHAALIDELETYPKPGLVSLLDNGSHADMDADRLRRSADAIRPYFADLVAAGAGGADLPALRCIGLAAEAAMMAATNGINAHRGAIFSLGLICAAEGATSGRLRAAEDRAVAVARLWGDALGEAPLSSRSHGGRAARRHGVGGAGREAAEGFPTVREIGLPALRRARAMVPATDEAARVQCLFALLAVVNDTNLLHRGGAEGLASARRSARRFLEAGGIAAPGWRERAVDTHLTFVARGLSPGGCADLLAATLLLDALERLP